MSHRRRKKAVNDIENNIFTIFLLGVSTQDGGKRERSDVGYCYKMKVWTDFGKVRVR